MDEHNHALGALRYLVSRIDSHKMARAAGQRKTEAVPEPPRLPKSWLRYDNESLWNNAVT